MKILTLNQFECRKVAKFITTVRNFNLLGRVICIKNLNKMIKIQ